MGVFLKCCLTSRFFKDTTTTTLRDSDFLKITFLTERLCARGSGGGVLKLAHLSLSILHVSVRMEAAPHENDIHSNLYRLN